MNLCLGLSIQISAKITKFYLFIDCFCYFYCHDTAHANYTTSEMNERKKNKENFSQLPNLFFRVLFCQSLQILLFSWT